jgi:hypothetical protein
MKKIMILLLLASFAYANAQQVVVDPAVVAALTANHIIQNGTLNNIEDEQNKIKNLQTTINIKLLQIKALQQKAYDKLRYVSDVVAQGKNVIYASTIALDIAEYQQQMIETAHGNPLLYTVALKTELALINRTYDLFMYISTALTGGEINLMTNMERMKIVNHVVSELRLMRGLAYGVNRRMRIASYGSLFKAVMQEYNVGIFNWNQINRSAIMMNKLERL